MEFAQQLKSNLDIVQVVGEYVRLKKAGSRYVAPCPFHTEKTPSFGVNATHQFYKCFGCGVGGDVIKFVMEMDSLTFWEACTQLAERYGIPLPKRMDAADEDTRRRAGLYEMHEIAQKLYRGGLASAAGAEAREYLSKRGVNAKLAEEFGLGLSDRGGQTLARQLQQAGFGAPQLESSGLVLARNDGSGYFDRFRGRLMFPIHSETGKIIAFAGRALSDEDQPKYLNSSESDLYKKGQVLYNLHRAKKGMRQNDHCILVEGYMDVIGLYGAGVTEVVASCGTALRPEQVRMMRRHSENIVVNFDPDPAGAAATERSISMLVEEGMHIRVLALPDELDPDEFIQERGVEAYRALCGKSPRYFEWLSDRAREKFDVRSGEGRVEAFKFLLPAIQKLPDKLERAAVASDVASQLGVDRGLVLEQFRKLAIDRSNRPMRAPKVELPANEKVLLRCLLSSEEARNQALPAMAGRELNWQAETARIVAAMQALGSDFNFGQLEARLNEGDRTLLTGLIFADGGSNEEEEVGLPAEHAAAQALDCLRVMEGAGRETARALLKSRITAAEREGNVEEALRLSAELEGMSGAGRRRRQTPQ